MQKITPFLWFDNNAEEAMNFYTTVFKDSKVVDVRRYGEAGGQGPVTTGIFRIYNQEFMVLNGGPVFHFTPAISFFVNCENQEEIDYLWKALSEGGSKERCGWLKDKFGLSWQIVPSNLGGLLSHPDPAKARRVMEAMMKMDKLDIKALEEA